MAACVLARVLRVLRVLLRHARVRVLLRALVLASCACACAFASCTQKILAALVKSWLLWSQMQSSRRCLCRHELSSVHVLWFALFCADLLKDWMYVLSIQIHALGRETGRIVP